MEGRCVLLSLSLSLSLLMERRCTNHGSSRKLWDNMAIQDLCAHTAPFQGRSTPHGWSFFHICMLNPFKIEKLWLQLVENAVYIDYIAAKLAYKWFCLPCLAIS